MKEQSGINNDKAIILEEGFGNTEGTSVTEPMVERKKKKCNLERFLMYARLLMFFKVIIFVAWLCAHVYRNYRNQTEQEKIIMIDTAKRAEEAYFLEMQNRLQEVQNWQSRL
ncbi:uncharacterized protein LOC100881030 [Megachile rotundata]|uniref:uncharacterized protein LOC100881030 n=1 Tax=Megachile rotundata TaxID=143995 RepID=UPI000258EF66|nr:PREDICTED: uncharacterized protein LOC100881030 [Megachile rotundata]